MAGASLPRSDFYVYVIFRPNGIPCYVGKGSGIRDQVHEIKGSHNPHLSSIFKLAGGVLPRVRLREGLTDKEALELEKIYIATIGREIHGGPLVNQTDGGEGAAGVIRSAETRLIMSIAQRGKIVPHSQRLNQCISHLQRKGRAVESIGALEFKLTNFQRKFLGKPPLTKREQAELTRKRNIGNNYGAGNKRSLDGQARVTAAVITSNSVRPVTDEYREKRRKIAIEMWAKRGIEERQTWYKKVSNDRIGGGRKNT